ncbi:hypothetical protein L2E82_15250 [Cichorium intybus]|uniref:Uncharacterized protein n=1 Tax=Cichorium intybus TaxID=13427 RepID=A0ACB9F3J5_CICIN|nr:hypothetical protein L2E82_15250 [Cichorium intybus]
MQYYLDPLSGYVFFSKLDALRYLDSGDIKKCAMRPLRRDTSQENNQIRNLNEEELASPPEPSKEPETPKAIQNGGVTESITEGTGTEKKKARSITGDGLLPMPKSSQKDASWLPDGWVVEIKYRDNGMKIKKPEEKPKSEPKKEAKKEAAPKPKPEAEAAPEEEEAPKPKAKNPLDLLPPSKMVLDDWKRLYSNTKTNFREVAIKDEA